MGILVEFCSQGREPRPNSPPPNAVAHPPLIAGVTGAGTLINGGTVRLRLTMVDPAQAARLRSAQVQVVGAGGYAGYFDAPIELDAGTHRGVRRSGHHGGLTHTRTRNAVVRRGTAARDAGRRRRRESKKAKRSGQEGSPGKPANYTVTVRVCGEVKTFTGSFAAGTSDKGGEGSGQEVARFSANCGLRVRGKAVYEDRGLSGGVLSSQVLPYPIRFARVQVSRESDNAVIGVGLTKQDGRFDIRFNNDGPKGYFVGVFAFQDNSLIGQRVVNDADELYAVYSSIVDETAEPDKTFSAGCSGIRRRRSSPGSGRAAARDPAAGTCPATSTTRSRSTPNPTIPTSTTTRSCCTSSVTSGWRRTFAATAPAAGTTEITSIRASRSTREPRPSSPHGFATAPSTTTWRGAPQTA